MTQPTYYPIQKNWRKLKPLYEQPKNLCLSYWEMEAYMRGRRKDFGLPAQEYFKEYSDDVRPCQYETTDWRCMTGRRGRQPAYWDWVCHMACHWVVNTNYSVITELEPDRCWRIVESDLHSTIVDFDRMLLFDPNFLALDISAEETWEMTVLQQNSRILRVGQFAEHDLTAFIQFKGQFKDITPLACEVSG